MGDGYEIPAASALAKAIGYMTSLWPGLQVFLDHPHVSPDNNSCREREAVAGPW